MDNKNYVLACIDGSVFSTAVCDYASWIANTTGAPLKLMHNIEQRPRPAVADLSGSIGLGSQEELLEELIAVEQQRSRLLMEKGRIMLKAAEQRAGDNGVAEAFSSQRHGSLQESLIELETDIRVLVMGLRGEDHPAEGQLGTHIETVVRALHKPVLLVNQDFVAPKRIMLAYDGQEAANKALEMVCRSPLFKTLHCHLVYVGDEATSAGLLQGAGAALAEAGIDYEVQLLTGRTDEALCAYQAKHDIELTVMGAYSHHPLRDMLLGSFTAKMLSKSRRPLLLLR